MKINLFKKALSKFVQQKHSISRKDMMMYFKEKTEDYKDNSVNIYFKTKREFKKITDRMVRKYS
jgi:hypothetical protein